MPRPEQPSSSKLGDVLQSMLGIDLSESRREIEWLAHMLDDAMPA